VYQKRERMQVVRGKNVYGVRLSDTGFDVVKVAQKVAQKSFLQPIDSGEA
jgi:hypothetical protein